MNLAGTFCWLLLTLATSPLMAGTLTLLLEQQQDSQGNIKGYAIVKAEQSNTPYIGYPPQAEQSGILVTGQSKDNTTLYQIRLPLPTQQAETFDPRTGKAQPQSQPMIIFAAQPFEIRVPDSASLDHITLQPALNGSGKQQVARFMLNLASIQNALLRTTPQSGRASSTMLWETGPSSRRLDIVLVGDGFNAQEQDSWQRTAQLVADGLLADPVFAAWKQQINIRRVDLASAQSGVSELDRGIVRQTPYGMQIACYNIERLVCTDTKRVHAVIDPLTAPDGRDLVVAIANSPRYGGGGGAMASITAAPEAVELARHEIGHTLFGLADEYEYGTCNLGYEPSEANATRQYLRRNIKWQRLIQANVILPTPPGSVAEGVVGLFTGARYCARGMYRPTEDSKMRTLGRPWYAVNEARMRVVLAWFSQPRLREEWLSNASATSETAN